MAKEWRRFEKRAVIWILKDAHDGDTIRPFISLSFDEWAHPDLRFDGVYTPELTAKDPSIRARAFAARDRVRSLLPLGEWFTVETTLYASYAFKRFGARVWSPGGIYINQLLIDEGLGDPAPEGK